MGSNFFLRRQGREKKSFIYKIDEEVSLRLLNEDDAEGFII